MQNSEAIDHALEELDMLYTERSFFTRIRIMLKGIRAPRGSREYKEAQIELQRLTAPLAAIIMPVMAIALLAVMADGSAVNDFVVETQIIEADDTKPLDDIDDPLDTPPEDINDLQLDVPLINTPIVDMNAPVTDAPMTPQPQAFDAVMKSPVILKNIYGETRNAGTRGQALRTYSGDYKTEEAVMRALRWLKTQQQANGSWKGSAEGISATGLALLAFLAHGEVPGDSPEFGETVQKGIEFLMRQPNPDPVAVHALAESYGMTMNPNLKVIASQALKKMVDSLRKTKWGPGRDGDGTTRPALLRMTFSVMALRSAQLSRIEIEGMDEALAKLKDGFMCQGNKERGGFSSDGFGPPGANFRHTGTWHFMIGVVGMQYLGAYADPIIGKTMNLLDGIWPPPTLGTSDIACCPVRSNYFATMVFFNHGGKYWERWNKSMKEVYTKGQEVETGKYTDHNGKAQAVGFWHCEDQHIGLQPIMPTCYIVQQLMVYYRYLPTSSKEAWEGAAEQHATATDADDVELDVGNL